MATEKRLIDANAIKYREYRGGGGRDYPENIVTEDEIAKLPTVDAVEVVHGRWKPKPHHKINSEGRLIKYCDFYFCSECGAERPITPPYNYCPNCGAKMDGDGNG